MGVDFSARRSYPSISQRRNTPLKIKKVIKMFSTFQPFDATQTAARPAGEGTRVRVAGEGHQVPEHVGEPVEVPDF